MKPKTALVKALSALRRKALKRGLKILTLDEIRREVKRRR
jgi:hypothetical protein